MNPEENNNLPNGPARPDVNAENLAAALDNLTAAGRAMGDGMSMPNLTENPTAEMNVPAADEGPLVPAAPVPGSIGSVMSVPAEDINQGAPMDTNPLMGGQPAQGPTMGGMPNPAQPPMSNQPLSPLEMANRPAAPQSPNPFIPAANNDSTTVPGAGMPPVAPETKAPTMPPKDGMGAPANNPAPNGFAPYNPFAPNNNNPTMPPVQPNVNEPKKMMTKPAKGGGSALPWILMGLFLLTTILFGVLYVMKMMEEPQVIYKPMPTEGETSNSKVSIMSCNRSLEGVTLNDAVALSGFQDITLNFKDDELTNIAVKTDATFPALDENSEPQTSTNEVSMSAEDITAELAPSVLLTADMDGNIDLSKEALKTTYTAQGFFCQDE